jgi:putative transcriptional regulator
MESFRGQLLLAGAGLVGATFRKTVILVAEHSDDGALGFVLNRPSPALLMESVPELSGVALADRHVYEGGPVQPEAVAVIAEFEHPVLVTNPIFDAIGFMPALSTPEIVAGIKRAKLFSGYAGWGPGQLENELEEDAWIIEPASIGDVFSTEPADLWASVLRRKGGRFQLLSTMPFDPNLN